MCVGVCLGKMVSGTVNEGKSSHVNLRSEYNEMWRFLIVHYGTRFLW